MSTPPTIPDLPWYLGRSARYGGKPRCPFATVERCPRYYQSLALLGEAGSTKIGPDEDARLLEKWKRSELWPRTGEYETALGGPDGRWTQYVNFCPEVTFDCFGYFAVYLHRYSDEIDADTAHARLAEMGVPRNDPRWNWDHVEPMHYSECYLYSLLSTEGDMTEEIIAPQSRRIESETDKSISEISEQYARRGFRYSSPFWDAAREQFIKEIDRKADLLIELDASPQTSTGVLEATKERALEFMKREHEHSDISDHSAGTNDRSKWERELGIAVDSNRSRLLANADAWEKKDVSQQLTMNISGGQFQGGIFGAQSVNGTIQQRSEPRSTTLALVASKVWNWIKSLLGA